ncbi:MAG: hypothetical protein Kow00107_04170 [Planctomycetota bacterium]
MNTILRWGFWILSGIVLLGAVAFGVLVLGRYSALKSAWSAYTKSQNKVKTLANKDFPNDATIKKAEELLGRMQADLEALVRDNYDREFRRTKFEQFLGGVGTISDAAAVDLNRYRSAYEKGRDTILSRAQEEAGLQLPAKENCGFQYFEKGAALSADSLPLIQKRYWISESIYNSIISYNNSPAMVKGWVWSDESGESAADLPAKVTAVRAVTHKGFWQPPDLPQDHRSWSATRGVMAPFYYFRYWQAELDLEIPAAAAPALIAKLLEARLPAAVGAIHLSRLKDAGSDRYSLPLSRLTVGLYILDFDQDAFADLIPELSRPEAEDIQ